MRTWRRLAGIHNEQAAGSRAAMGLHWGGRRPWQVAAQVMILIVGCGLYLVFVLGIPTQAAERHEFVARSLIRCDRCSLV